jgi:SAM-dependent methyltransferase
MIFSYKGKLYPDYLKHGNACQFITPVARQFCKGSGLDIGAGKWPLPGAIPVELKDGGDAMNLPEGLFDFIFSSHCLEHLANPIAALEHWKTRIVDGGVIFLYLPHPEMEYWRPENCRKHLHSWTPERMVEIIQALGFKNVMHSQRDLAWGFSVVGRNI